MGIVWVNVFAVSLPAEHGRRDALHICNECHRLGFFHGLVGQTLSESRLGGHITSCKKKERGVEIKLDFSFTSSISSYQHEVNIYSRIHMDVFMIELSSILEITYTV